MKKLYSTITMLAIMVAALSLTACGGSDDDEIGGDGNSSDDEEYFEITINGEKYISSSWYGAVLVGMNRLYGCASKYFQRKGRTFSVINH